MSSRESIALRKSLLVMRAAVERVELAETVTALRHGLRWSTLLKAALPSVAASQGLPLLVQMLRRFPILSAALTFFRPRLARGASVRGVLRWTALLGLLWQGWKLSKSWRAERAERRGVGRP